MSHLSLGSFGEVIFTCVPGPLKMERIAAFSMKLGQFNIHTLMNEVGCLFHTSQKLIQNDPSYKELKL